MPDKDAPESTPNDTQVEDQKEGQTEKTYTKAELDAEADRRATKASKAERERVLAEAEAERHRLEAERLAEQGEFKTLHEKSQAELDALKTTLANKEQRENISAGLREAGLSDFETALLADRSDPKSFVDAAKTIADLVKSRVDAEVADRLETGRKTTSQQTAEPDSRDVLKNLYPDMHVA